MPEPMIAVSSVAPSSSSIWPSPSAAFLIPASTTRIVVDWNKHPPTSKRSRQKQEPFPRKLTLDVLPQEILSAIALYLLPPLVTFHGFPAPHETPYPPTSLSITGVKKGERFGSVPYGVIDVVNLARSCRATMRAAGRIMDSFGGSVAPVKVKVEREDSPRPFGRFGPSRNSSSAYPSVTKSAVEAAPREPESCEKSKQVAEQERTWLGSKEGARVAKRVLYLQVDHCAEEADNLRDFILENRGSLEELVFYKCPVSHSDTNESARPLVSLAQMRPLQEDFQDQPALPKLRKLQVGPKLCCHCTVAALHMICSIDFGSKAGNDAYQSPPSASFSADIIIRSALQTPHYSTFAWEFVKFPRAAAPDLKILELHMPTPVPDYSSEAQIFTPLLRHIAEDVAKQLDVFSLILRGVEKKWGGFGRAGGSSSVLQRKVSEVEQDLDTEVELVKGRAGSQLSKSEKESRDKKRITDRYMARVRTMLGKPSRASGNPPLAEVLVEADTRDNNTPTVQMDVVETPVAKQESDADRSDTASIAESSVNGSHTTPSDSSSVPNRARKYERNGANQLVRVQAQFRSILTQIAMTFPNLCGLRAIRNGTSRVDIVEGVLSLEAHAAVFVEPLRQMTRLRFLDLGLAVIGRKEVQDFPLGVSASCGSKSAQVGNWAGEIKRRKWTADATVALQEGDAWRRKVLNRFVLGICETATDDSLPNTTHHSEEERAVSRGWPTTIEEGYIYSVDLLDRGKRRGLLTTWMRSSRGNNSHNEGLSFGPKTAILL